MIKNIVTVCFLTCLVLPAIAYYGPSTFYSVVLNDRQQIYSRSDLEDAAQARENVLNLIRRNIDPPESWTGKWLPERVTEAPPVNNKAPSQNHDTQRMLNDINAKCDDGTTNLFVDWDESPINYTCFNQGGIFMPDLSVSTIIRQQLIPPEYHARHVCMDSEIHYDSLPPTFGPHRPAWAKYGEYKFLPMQRWVHNLEHGAVVMLYHPCAHPFLIQELRSIVKNCLYRHIITPYTHLSPQRPLALVTWGWMMLMPDVNPNRVIEFIKDKALNGPEHLLADGQYDHLLLQHARVVSTRADEIICPRESF